MPDERGRFRCGEFGNRTKSGSFCGYVVPPGKKYCLHHDPDPQKKHQTAVLTRARQALRESTVPDIETNGFESIDHCLKVRAAVVKELTTKPRPNMRALDMILKACNGASADHGVKVQQKTNEILLMLDGHGAGVAALQRLRESSVRVLPGRKKILDITSITDAKKTSCTENPEQTKDEFTAPQSPPEGA